MEPKGVTGNKISGSVFAILSIFAYVITGVIYVLGIVYLFFWALILIIVGFPFFLKSMRAKEPSLSVHVSIFTASAILSIIGTLIMYLVLRQKGFI